jgi:hypothetical protein
VDPLLGGRRRQLVGVGGEELGDRHDGGADAEALALVERGDGVAARRAADDDGLEPAQRGRDLAGVPAELVGEAGGEQRVAGAGQAGVDQRHRAQAEPLAPPAPRRRRQCPLSRLSQPAKADRASRRGLGAEAPRASAARR